ncbi:MAG TPA: hypothetical protein VGG46_04375 [Terriglobales bacterium]|jgi:hypothetical protein
MLTQDFIREYETKSNEELLRLATDPSQLTEEANYVLAIELRKRRLDAKEQIINFQQQENEQKQKQELDIGRLWFIYTFGIGRKRFCEGDYRYDPATQVEEFTTTIFILLFWVPLIPTGTYRVTRIKGFRPPKINAIDRLSLDWKQVMKVWLITLGVLSVVVGWEIFRS